MQKNIIKTKININNSVVTFGLNFILQKILNTNLNPNI